MPAVEPTAPSRGSSGFTKAIVLVLLCGTLYVAIPVYLLLSEIEELAVGPRAADVEDGSVILVGIAFVLLMVLAGSLLAFALPKGSSPRVIFFAHAPIVGIQLYQIYTRSLPMALSHFTDRCYKALKESTKDPLEAFACPRILPQSWKHTAVPILSGEHFAELNVVTVCQGFVLYIYGLVWLIAMLKGKDDKATGKTLAGQAKLKAQYEGVTITELDLKPVFTVKTSNAIGAVINLLSQRGFEHIAIVSDDSDEYLGLVTREGIASYILGGSGTIDRPISEVLTDLNQQSSSVAPIVTLETTLTDLSAIFEQNSAAVVTESTSDRAKPVHVVTKLDLLGYLVKHK